MRARLATCWLAGSFLQSGDLVIYRAAAPLAGRNREDALDKLVALIRKAAVRPRKRIATKATKGSKLRRLESKARRSDVKAKRRTKPGLDD
jgi:ribosome-associated protein